MSERYPGGIISKTAPTVSANPPSAPGMWTIEQQAAYQQAGTWPYGGPFNYIEDVFSTYLYTGNGSSQTITNGIDLAGKGGLFWVKARAVAGSNGLMYGSGTELCSNSTNGLPASQPYTFGASGITFTGGIWSGFSSPNESGRIYASWTFRKQPKFFDVVTFATDSSGNATVSHSLGSTPGCILIKRTSGSQDWKVYHRSLNVPTNRYLELNTNGAEVDAGQTWITVSSTQISFPGNRLDSSSNYVAYLFAHNAGGFGLTGTDNVISCGSFSTDGSGNATVTLGYEPQWVLTKCITFAKSWMQSDIMRGMPVGYQGYSLSPDSSAAENQTNVPNPTATGFTTYDTPSQTYIYIAIRRGPMKTPTSGTSVYNGTAYTGNDAQQTFSSGFVPDLLISNNRNGGGSHYVTDRLRSNLYNLYTNYSDAETSTASNVLVGTTNGQWQTGTYTISSASGNNYVNYQFARAPGFMDEVCYTGTGANTSFSHNLTVVPEMMIFKRRSNIGSWLVYHKDVGNDYSLSLESTAAKSYSPTTFLNGTSPTASVFTVGIATSINAVSTTYIAYLFASCPGVSKVGSYTGTGATLTISCGFAARWVMIKRTDSTGDWWVWDTARGMVAATDPRFAFNSTATETNANWVYTDASGFQIVTTDGGVNANGGSYIYLAIA